MTIGKSVKLTLAILAIVCSLTIGVRASFVDDFLKTVGDFCEEVLVRKPRLLLKTFRNKLGATYLYDQPTSLPPTDEYDFVIVGSGSSGSVLANRLSERADWRVLLLEAGDEPSSIVDVPILAPLLYFSGYNWGYTMEKQANVSLGFVDGRMAWPRGRALGGTTVINYMIHMRGNRADYDRWAGAGNAGWSYDDVLPYFKKSEDYAVRRQDARYHGSGGYLRVEDVPHRSEAARAFVAAAEEFGLRYVDYNGKDQLGVSFVHGTTSRGARGSAERSFLRPVRDRGNLRVVTRARVTKVLIDAASKRALGVEFSWRGRYREAIARKEVVLSAGAFNSPQLLMLSGVGPRAHLAELAIPLVQDLPVGRKMYDHLAFFGLTFTVDRPIVLDQSELFRPRNAIDYFANRTGPYTSIGGVEALAFVRTRLSRDAEPRRPDVELIFTGAHFNTDGGDFYRKTFRVTDELYDAMWKPLEASHAFGVVPMLLHPRSHGHLRLKSNNPFHWPLFYGNYFTDGDDFDRRTFVEAIRVAQRVVLGSSAFRAYGVRMSQRPVPGCARHRFDSDAYWMCALNYLATTLHHQVATCKMGPAADAEAVVDARLRVHGVAGLRVADTSVIPIPLSAHTNVPAFMVGERAADLIKEDWDRRGGGR